MEKVVNIIISNNSGQFVQMEWRFEAASSLRSYLE